MPMTKEEKSAYNKEWAKKHKERRKAYQTAYNEKYKEKLTAQHKEYNEKNKEANLIKHKLWLQTPKGKKSVKISDWKHKGIISDDWDALYERYVNCEYCEHCRVKLTQSIRPTKTTRCLDHNHDITDRENVRNILCWFCNIQRG
jgi:hypothetical protein